MFWHVWIGVRSHVPSSLCPDELNSIEKTSFRNKWVESRHPIGRLNLAQRGSAAHWKWAEKLQVFGECIQLTVESKNLYDTLALHLVSHSAVWHDAGVQPDGNGGPDCWSADLPPRPDGAAFRDARLPVVGRGHRGTFPAGQWVFSTSPQPACFVFDTSVQQVDAWEAAQKGKFWWCIPRFLGAFTCRA